jgi:hypothetical protein
VIEEFSPAILIGLDALRPVGVRAYAVDNGRAFSPMPL